MLQHTKAPTGYHGPSRDGDAIVIVREGFQTQAAGPGAVVHVAAHALEAATHDKLAGCNADARAANIPQ